MKNVLEVLNEQHKTIVEKAREWGFSNVRVYAANAPFEKNLLNLLVDQDNKSTDKSHLLRMELEQTIDCAVNVVTYRTLGDFTFKQIINKAVSLENFALADVQRLFLEQDQSISLPDSFTHNEEKAFFSKRLTFLKKGLTEQSQATEIDIKREIERNNNLRASS